MLQFNGRLEEYRCYRGMSDRVAFGEPARQGWAGFWDWDHPKPPDQLNLMAKQLDRNLLLYHSGRGFHVMALDVTSWEKKLEWFDAWHRKDPGPVDYILQRDNVLRLNGKHGSQPFFVASYFIRPMRGSTFHLVQAYFLLGTSEEVLKELYPHLEWTAGRIKKYASDPNSVFEMLEVIR